MSRLNVIDWKPTQMLTDEDIRLLAKAIREGAAKAIRDGMDDSGGGISTLVWAGYGQ